MERHKGSGFVFRELAGEPRLPPLKRALSELLTGIYVYDQQDRTLEEYIRDEGQQAENREWCPGPATFDNRAGRGAVP